MSILLLSIPFLSVAVIIRVSVASFGLVIEEPVVGVEVVVALEVIEGLIVGAELEVALRLELPAAFELILVLELVVVLGLGRAVSLGTGAVVVVFFKGVMRDDDSGQPMYSNTLDSMPASTVARQGPGVNVGGAVTAHATVVGSNVRVQSGPPQTPAGSVCTSAGRSQSAVDAKLTTPIKLGQLSLSPSFPTPPSLPRLLLRLFSLASRQERQGRRGHVCSVRADHGELELALYQPPSQFVCGVRRLLSELAVGRDAQAPRQCVVSRWQVFRDRRAGGPVSRRPSTLSLRNPLLAAADTDRHFPVAPLCL
ncbi:hypothetical protein PG989_016557 [Apiospora arundinis]